MAVDTIYIYIQLNLYLSLALAVLTLSPSLWTIFERECLRIRGSLEDSQQGALHSEPKEVTQMREVRSAKSTCRVGDGGLGEDEESKGCSSQEKKNAH